MVIMTFFKKLLDKRRYDFIFISGSKGNTKMFGGRMRKLIFFIILYSVPVILCPSTNAQWEGAQIQQLTNDDLPNKILRLYIDGNDKLYLFYLQGVRDTITGHVYDYRIFYITKGKGGEWSQPEEIKTPTYIFGQNRKAGLWMDTRTGIINILYTPYPLYNILYYTNSTIPNWELDKIDSLPDQQWGEQYYSFLMDFDSLGNVHLVWHQDYDSAGYTWFRVVYANNSTGAWVKQVVSPHNWAGYGSSGGPIFCVQKDGTAHIIYGPYVRNDSLNSQNWHTDTIPRPPIAHGHRYAVMELLADASDRIHLFTESGDIWWEDTVYQFYYYKQGKDSIWSGPEEVQVYPPDSGLIREYFIDHENSVHLILTRWGGFNVYYTNRKNGSWLEPQLLLYEYDAVGAGSTFKFVIDCQGHGHGVFIGYKYHGGIPDEDSTEVYYFASTTSVQDTLQDQKIFSFQLFQNYPNPFNTNTVIRYSLSADRLVPVLLKIYNILGKEVKELAYTKQGRGTYQVNWDGKDNSGRGVSSGIYFYQLKEGDNKETRKLVLIK
jgi:hypothetical protein